MENKSIATIALIISLIAVVIGYQAKNVPFGGYTAGHWDSANGYKVDGTTVIDGDGNYDGAITGTSATLSSTLTVTGETNLVNLIHGGSLLSYATSEDIVLTAANVCNSNIISVDCLDSACALTLPASTTLVADCLPAVGDIMDFIVENATSGTANVTITEGTGITLVSDDSGGDVLAAAGWARVECQNVRSGEFLCIVDPYTDAD